jgi:hypothetical protein
MADEISLHDQIRLGRIIASQSKVVGTMRHEDFDDKYPRDPITPPIKAPSITIPIEDTIKKPDLTNGKPDLDSKKFGDLTKGRYRIKWEGSKNLDERIINKSRTIISVDGIKKQVLIHSIKIKGTEVIADISILQNPIPLIMVGYAILGVAGLTAGSFFVSEVNELASNTMPLIMIGGAIFIIINFKHIKGMI